MAAKPASMDMVIIARARAFPLFLFDAGGSGSGGGNTLGADACVSALSAISGIGGCLLYTSDAADE